MTLGFLDWTVDRPFVSHTSSLVPHRMAPSYSPETRRDPLRQQWVAFAPSRSSRPKHTNPDPDAPDPTDDRPVEGCPFCPGHEDLLPSILWELDEPDGLWRTRAVPNKYPAFRADGEPFDTASRLHASRASRGHQEVIIETPRHHEHLAQMPVARVDAVLQTFLHRYRAVRTEMDDFIPFLFRNHGATAGASIAHPHSQLIATDVPPPSVEQEEAAARAFFEEQDECPYCTTIRDEVNAQERLVFTNEHFVAFVPYAAHVPYETWIVPRRHEPEFGRLSRPVRTALARTLHTVLSRLRNRLDDPDYNFFVRTALEYESTAPHLHWSLRIQPRMTFQAGFEVSTGLRINPSIPERDAAVLRGT